MYGLAMVKGEKVFIKPKKGQWGYNPNGSVVEANGEIFKLNSSDLHMSVAYHNNFIPTHEFLLTTEYARKEELEALQLGGKVFKSNRGQGRSSIGSYAICKKIILTPIS